MDIEARQNVQVPAAETRIVEGYQNVIYVVGDISVFRFWTPGNNGWVDHPAEALEQGLKMAKMNPHHPDEALARIKKALDDLKGKVGEEKPGA